MFLQRRAAAILGRERVGRCLWDIASNQSGVSILATPPGPETRARYYGLQTCGSVWSCPVCADRIARCRRDEMNAALAAARSEGLGIFLMTLTFSHQAGELLADTMGALKAAKRALHQHRAFRSLRPRIIGTITATEITKGGNGWHPHLHVIVFWQGADAPGMLEPLREPWLASLAGKGRTGAGAAFDVQDARHAGNYVAKWGAGEEMTMSAAKGGKKSRAGLHPFALLDRSAFDPSARAAFYEFALTMKGRRSLVWSPGLKARFGIGEVSDQDAASVPEPAEAIHEVARFGRDTWPAARSRGRPRLLEAAERGGSQAVAEVVEGGSRVPAAARSAERTTLDAPGTAHPAGVPARGPLLADTSQGLPPRRGAFLRPRATREPVPETPKAGFRDELRHGSGTLGGTLAWSLDQASEGGASPPPGR